MKIREILRNFGIALLGWVLSGAGAFLAFWLQFLGSEKTDSREGLGFLMGWYWDVNLRFYVLGAVLSIVCFTVFWRLMLRRTLLNLLPLKKIWLLLWILLGLLVLFIHFMLFFLGMMMTITFLDSPNPEWTVGFPFVYVGYAVILMLWDSIRTVRNQKYENN